MKGDVIHIGEEHRAAAGTIVDHYWSDIERSDVPFVFTVAGESGRGKSETGHAIQEAVESRGKAAYVFQQDDYFVLPPKSNDARRREDISWVGTQEVRLDLLDEHLSLARERSGSVEKPVIDYDADRIESETVDLSNIAVIVAEGTYTTLLTADRHVFIDRNRLQTMESRKKRAREPIEPFLEQVLELEHQIIAQHKDRAHVIISNEYEVSFVE